MTTQRTLLQIGRLTLSSNGWRLRLKHGVVVKETERKVQISSQMPEDLKVQNWIDFLCLNGRLAKWSGGRGRWVKSQYK